MSWDIAIMKFTRAYMSAQDIPDDEPGLTLGSRDEVHARVNAAFPGTDWADPEWGVWEAPFGSIEFNVGDEDPVGDLMLHVRASEVVVPLIVALCLDNGWQGIDCGTGALIERSPSPGQGQADGRACRDQVAGGL
jgi:hypothetical protein